MYKNIIFDLDLTLVDTTILEPGRKSHQLNQVYEMIPQATLYPGMEKVLEVIRKHGIRVAIVSTSPRQYVEKVVAHFNIPCQFIVGYHDAEPIKPHPAPMQKALELLGVNAAEVLSFGDRAIDIQASNAAGIESIACFWGTKEKSDLIRSGYCHAIVTPEEILTMIR